MNKEIESYIGQLSESDREICNCLANTIDEHLMAAESKIWHAHPVWFLAGNPIVGFSKQKKGIRLMFWSGADFNEEKLICSGGKFKDASKYFNAIDEIEIDDLKRWLDKSIEIQWDYKNIVKRKGQLVRI